MGRWMGEWRSLPVPPAHPFLQHQHLGWAAGQKHGAKKDALCPKGHTVKPENKTISLKA